MKKYILILIAVEIISIPLHAQSCFPVDTAVLNRTYQEWKLFSSTPESASPEREKAFFDAFPSTWMEYILTYDYCSLQDPPTYIDLSEHLDAFEHLADNSGAIPDTVYCQKIIKLSIGGKTGPDAPGGLQQVVRRYIKKKPVIVFEQLSKMKRGQQLRFWLFCWHSTLKKGTQPQELAHLQTTMEKTWPEEVKIMNIAFEYSWGEAVYPPDLPFWADYPHKYDYARKRAQESWQKSNNGMK
jgi:hypothetical protein